MTAVWGRGHWQDGLEPDSGRRFARFSNDKLSAKHADAKYKAFCERYLWLLEAIEKRFDTRLSLRRTDDLLLVIADAKSARRAPAVGLRP